MADAAGDLSHEELHFYFGESSTLDAESLDEQDNARLRRWSPANDLIKHFRRKRKLKTIIDCREGEEE